MFNFNNTKTSDSNAESLQVAIERFEKMGEDGEIVILQPRNYPWWLCVSHREMKNEREKSATTDNEN